MIRKLLKWMGIIVLTLVGIVLTGYFYIAHTISQRAEKTYSFTAQELPVSTDSSALNRGKHLVAIKGCTECHGANMAGKIMEESPEVGLLAASNLTKGKGGLPANYSTADWVKALRHGIDRNGRPLLIMPSHETALLSGQDMAAIIAYCQQLPPVANVVPKTKPGPILNVMTYLDKVPLLPVEMIDHNRPLIAKADTSTGIAQGKYLAVACSGCHRPNLKGGDAIVPGQPPVPDITRRGALGKWSQEQFITTLRTGKTPGGHQLKNEDMPWKMTAEYSQKELVSLYQYLQSLQ
ncbi:c-type cytochrome [Spirosoma daeguense]